DRNKNIEVLSSTGPLRPWEKKLVEEVKYRYLQDMQLVAMEVFQQQFVYLTDQAVLSNAWAGKLYLEHGLPAPTHFAMGEGHNILVAAKDRLALFKGDEKIGDLPLAGDRPIQLISDDENG